MASTVSRREGGSRNGARGSTQPLPRPRADDRDFDVAGESRMLQTVVAHNQIHFRMRLEKRSARFKSGSTDGNGDSSFPCNEKRLVAGFGGRSLLVDQSNAVFAASEAAGDDAWRQPRA